MKMSLHKSETADNVHAMRQGLLDNLNHDLDDPTGDYNSALSPSNLSATTVTTSPQSELSSASSPAANSPTVAAAPNPLISMPKLENDGSSGSQGREQQPAQGTRRTLLQAVWHFISPKASTSPVISRPLSPTVQLPRIFGRLPPAAPEGLLAGGELRPITNSRVCWTDKWVLEEKRISQFTSVQLRRAHSRHIRAILHMRDKQDGVVEGENFAQFSLFITHALLNYADAMVAIKQEVRDGREGRQRRHWLAQVMFALLALFMCMPPLHWLAVWLGCCRRCFPVLQLEHSTSGSGDSMGLVPSEHLKKLTEDIPWSRKEFISEGLLQLQVASNTDTAELERKHHDAQPPTAHHKPYRSTESMLSSVRSSMRIPWNQDTYVQQLGNTARLIEEQMEMNGFLIFTNPDAYQFALKEARNVASDLKDRVLKSDYAQTLVHHFEEWRPSVEGLECVLDREAHLLARLSRRGVWLYCWVFAFYGFCQEVPSWEPTYERTFLPETEDDNTYRVVELVQHWKEGPWGVRLRQVYVGLAFALYLCAAVATTLAVGFVSTHDDSIPAVYIRLTWAATGIVVLAAVVTAYNSARRAFSLLSFSADVYDNLQTAAHRIGNDRMSVAISLVYLLRILDPHKDKTEVPAVKEEGTKLRGTIVKYVLDYSVFTVIRSEQQCLGLIQALECNTTLERLRLKGDSFFRAKCRDPLDSRGQLTDMTWLLARALFKYSVRERQSAWGLNSGCQWPLRKVVLRNSEFAKDSLGAFCLAMGCAGVRKLDFSCNLQKQLPKRLKASVLLPLLRVSELLLDDNQFTHHSGLLLIRGVSCELDLPLQTLSLLSVQKPASEKERDAFIASVRRLCVTKPLFNGQAGEYTMQRRIIHSRTQTWKLCWSWQGELPLIDVPPLDSSHVVEKDENALQSASSSVKLVEQPHIALAEDPATVAKFGLSLAVGVLYRGVYLPGVIVDVGVEENKGGQDEEAIPAYRVHADGGVLYGRWKAKQLIPLSFSDFPQLVPLRDNQSRRSWQDYGEIPSHMLLIQSREERPFNEVVQQLGATDHVFRLRRVFPFPSTRPATSRAEVKVDINESELEKKDN